MPHFGTHGILPIDHTIITWLQTEYRQYRPPFFTPAQSFSSQSVGPPHSPQGFIRNPDPG